MFAEPVCVSFVQQREVKEFGAEFGGQSVALQERAEFSGRELVLLEFVEQRADFLREARPARAPAEQFQFLLMPQEQRAQHHDPAFIA